MPTNKELMDAILAINSTHELKNAQGKPMSNAEMAAELKRLKSGEQGDDTPAEQPEAEKEGYRIAKGKALTVAGRGMLREGDEVKAEWLPNGEDQMAMLITKGYIE